MINKKVPSQVVPPKFSSKFVPIRFPSKVATKVAPQIVKTTLGKKVAVWGWWQGRNLGDMWILESIKQKFPNIIPINTTIKDFSQYDFLIIGGGGLINGFKIIPPFNELLPVKYGSFGLGGEFPITDEYLGTFINNSDFFGVRDKRNLMTFSTTEPTKLELSSDCTFLFPLNRNLLKPNKNIINIRLIWRDPFRLLNYHNNPNYNVQDGLKLNELFGNHLGKIPYNDNNKCLELYKNVLANYGKVIYDDYVVDNFKIQDMYTRYGGTDLIVTMRYHGVMAAIQLGIPCIALDIYPKVRTLMQDCGMEKYCIKLSEYGKINNLIIDIKKNWDVIMDQMKTFTIQQSKIANDFAAKIKSVINI